ncbi:MAG: hypothetical protein AVDCRST_MAG69-308 [uncultured Solirubrobacteraceae bacterium]|uniref:Blue (type 1) copper domain-containing protein n=1 Tax=uncultured Solirubrobacteraceae bacterium TaxID=1162706 RepID=A0A6J4RRG6_9ACTN|nr:MAG: hypothetical protein AVDCRST_MAG69-308 [uncultured Solirubrobacteraceae bacterium]
MRRAATTWAVLAAVAWPAAAEAQEHGGGHGAHGEPPQATGAHVIAIANRAYSPARLTLLAGDSVTWRNDDFVTHDATGPAGLPASGPLMRGQRFSQTFADVGSHPYVCTFHAFMQGRIDVHAALLTAASSSVLTGEEIELHGRAAATSGPVVLEAQPAGAAGFTPVTTVTPDADGAFHAALRPSSSTTYRAVTTSGASPPVTVAVTSRLRVRLSARRTKRFTVLRVAAPGAGAATATIQLYSRERFSWIDRGHRRLDARGRAAFRLRSGLRYHARAVITRPDGGAILGVSARVKLPRRAASR